MSYLERDSVKYFLIFLVMTSTIMLAPQAFASPSYPHLQPQFDGPRGAPFSIGLFFGALGIIGVCIFLIICSRKEHLSRVKWFYLFISLSLLLIFSIFYATDAFDFVEEYMLESD